MRLPKLHPFVIAVIQIVLIAAACYALYLIKSVVVYAVIALYLSVLGSPLMNVLQRIPKIGAKMGNSLRAAIALILIMGLAAGIATWFFPVLISEFSFLYAIEYDKLIQGLQSEWSQLDSLLLSFGINSNTELEQLNETLQSFASVDAISGALSGIMGSVGNIIAGLFSVVFISFFLFREKDLAHRFIDTITPKSYHHKVDLMTPQIKTIVTRYSFGILFQISAVFTLLAIGMSLIGVQGAVVLALCASVFNLIPYVGPLIGAALGILLGMGQLYTAGLTDPAEAVNLLQSLYLLIGLFIGVQLLDNVVFQPIIFSNSVGAHPLEIFLVISIAGTLLGIGGMIIAVPMYSIGRIVFNTALKTIDE